MNVHLRNFALWVIIILPLLALFALFQNPGQRTASSNISVSQLLNEVDQGRVYSVVIQGPEIHGTFTDGHGFQTYAPNDPDLVQKLYQKNVQITVRPLQNDISWFASLLISWLPIFAMIGLWILLARQIKAVGFGRSRAKLLTDGAFQTLPTQSVSATAGGTQGTSVPLTAMQVQLTGPVSGASGFLLPPARQGMQIAVANNTGNATAPTAFGSGTDTINGIAGATGVATGDNNAVTIYYAFVTGAWMTK